VLMVSWVNSPIYLQSIRHCLNRHIGRFWTWADGVKVSDSLWYFVYPLCDLVIFFCCTKFHEGVCCSLFVVRCPDLWCGISLRSICCSLFVVCCLLFVVWCSLFVEPYIEHRTPVKSAPEVAFHRVNTKPWTRNKELFIRDNSRVSVIQLFTLTVPSGFTLVHPVSKLQFH
jgi:hypothetical protein